MMAGKCVTGKKKLSPGSDSSPHARQSVTPHQSPVNEGLDGKLMRRIMRWSA
jgi:hypothetical protein